MREEEREAEHEDLLSDITDKVKKLQNEKKEEVKLLKESKVCVYV